MQEFVDIARQHDIIIHCDEVYRPLFHSLQAEMPHSILDFGYDKTIATGSMSKAFSLAGIRLGWIASKNPEIIESCASVRDYTLISVGRFDDSVAAYALSSPCVDNLLQRNLHLAKQNLDDLEAFVREFDCAVTWVRPQAGTTAFLKFVKDGRPVNDVLFCQQLFDAYGVMLVPGSQCFGEGQDYMGFVRVGYVPERQAMVDGLEALKRFMKNGFESVPTMS